MMSKAIVRNKLRQKRLALGQDDIIAKSQAIIERVKKLVDWPAVKELHCFVPRTELNEVDVRDLFEFVWQKYPHIATYTTPKNHGLQYLRPGFVYEKAAKQLKFDVIIVPMLGFDARLHRLGYGGGYYDRFLAAQPRAQKIGVCFELGRVDILPMESHDVPLDIVVTENNIEFCNT